MLNSPSLPPPLVSFHWKLFSSTNKGQDAWSFKHLQILYREFCSRKEIPSTAQAKLKDEYPNLFVHWKENYLLVFNTTLETKVRVFQYKFWYKLNFSKSRLLAKFYICRCKLHKSKPSLEVLRLLLSESHSWRTVSDCPKKWYTGKPLRKVGIFYSRISVSNSLSTTLSLAYLNKNLYHAMQISWHFV